MYCQNTCQNTLAETKLIPCIWYHHHCNVENTFDQWIIDLSSSYATDPFFRFNDLFPARTVPSNYLAEANVNDDSQNYASIDITGFKGQWQELVGHTITKP